MLDTQHLVESHPVVAVGNHSDLVSIQPNRMVALVENDKVVSQTVHFGKA